VASLPRCHPDLCEDFMPQIKLPLFQFLDFVKAPEPM
jgi:hypothetical protein